MILYNPLYGLVVILYNSKTFPNITISFPSYFISFLITISYLYKYFIFKNIIIYYPMNISSPFLSINMDMKRQINMSLFMFMKLMLIKIKFDIDIKNDEFC